MDVAASEFYGTDKTYDLNFKEEVGFLKLCRYTLSIEVMALCKKLILHLHAF